MATLRTLRRVSGIKTGDLLVLKATHAGLSTSTFRDEVRLSDRGDKAPSLINRLLYFSTDADGEDTANTGLSASVRDFASDDRILTFTPDIAVPVAVGDEAELWTVSERIGSVDHIHELINFAIDTVAFHAGGEVYADEVRFDARTEIMNIPTSWKGGSFGGVSYTNRTGQLREIPDQYITVNPGKMTVRIRGQGAQLANMRMAQMYGYPPAGQLVNEGDITPVDANWIVETVSSALTLGPSWRSKDPNAAERRANFWATQAAAYRRDIAVPRRGLDIALPKAVS